MASIYEMGHSYEVETVLKSMTLKIANEFGVTRQGNRLTVRWYVDGELVDVHMIIENVTTVVEATEEKRKSAELQKLFAKYPDLREELYFAEHGEHSK